MGEKLSEMDDLVDQIINTMDNNTVLFILGDHGMNDVGDHGGGGSQETQTVVSAYYKGGFRKYKEPELEAIMKSYQENNAESRTLIQMDLAPTLAMLLGVPIPLSNTGQMINDFYLNEPLNEKEQSSKEFLARLVRDNYVNMLQTDEYLTLMQRQFKAYPLEEYLEVTNGYVKVKEKVKEFLSKSERDEYTTEDARTECVEIIQKMQFLSKGVYEIMKRSNSYDFFLMFAGIGLSISCFCLQVLLLQPIYLEIKGTNLRKQEDLTSRFLQELGQGIRLEKSLSVVFLSGILSYLLGTIHVVSVLLFLLSWKMLYILIKLNISNSIHFVNQLNIHAFKTTFSKLRFAVVFLDSPYSTLLAVFAIVFQVIVRLSVSLTRLESK